MTPRPLSHKAAALLAGPVEHVQPLENRRLMSAAGGSEAVQSFESGVAYDGDTLELRGRADGDAHLSVELDSDASHVRGVVNGRGGQWIDVDHVKHIRVLGGRGDGDTLSVDARLDYAGPDLQSRGIERLKAVPVLLTPRVRMAQYARLEAESYGKKLADRLNVKYAGLGELTQRQAIRRVSNGNAPKARVERLETDLSEGAARASVTGVSLLDVRTGKPVAGTRVVGEGEGRVVEVESASLADRRLRLSAELDEAGLANFAGSVRFEIGGVTRVENYAPYALATRGLDERLDLGEHDVRVTVFADKDAEGEVLQEQSFGLVVLADVRAEADADGEAVEAEADGDVLVDRDEDDGELEDQDATLLPGDDDDDATEDREDQDRHDADAPRANPTTPNTTTTPPAHPPLPPVPRPTVNAQAPTARIEALSLNIVEGHAVHLDAFKTVFRDGDFNDASFEWDFGDDGSRFDTLRGFTASHLYDRPGSYDVTLRVTDQGRRVSTASVRVTVAATQRRKFYVSNNGNDANDGRSAGASVRTMERAMQLLSAAGDHAELLLQRGQTHVIRRTMSIAADDVVVRGYGAGDKPTLRWSGPGGERYVMISAERGSRLVTVRGLAFDADGPGGADKDRANAFAPRGRESAFVDNTVHDVTTAVLMNSAPDGTLVLGNDQPDRAGLRAYFVWGQGSRLSVLGNTAINSTREHIVRIGNAKGITIAGNTFSNLDRRGEGDRHDYNKNTITLQRGSYGYVSDNHVHGHSSMGPLGDGDGLTDTSARFEYVVWENNVHDLNQLHIEHGTEHADVRFNLFEVDGGPAITTEPYAANYGRYTVDLSIHGNVARNDAERGSFLVLGKGIREVEVTKNVFVAPNLKVGPYGAAGVRLDGSDLFGGQVSFADNLWPSGRHGANFVGGGIIVVTGPRGGWYDAAEWNALGNVRGERQEDLGHAPSQQAQTAVLNAHGVPQFASLAA